MTLLSPNAANILRWCLHLRSRDIDDKGRDKAAQLYMLAGSFPAIPAGILLDLVEGRTTADAVLAASSFPICQGCADGIGGAAGGPDAPWRLAKPGEACQAEDCVIVSDITEIITASLDWRAGSDDIADAVDAWEQTGLCVEEITAWVEAGCFDAASAFALSDAGFSPAECAQQARTGETIAHSFCNGDIDLEDARLIISGELAEASLAAQEGQQ